MDMIPRLNVTLFLPKEVCTTGRRVEIFSGYTVSRRKLKRLNSVGGGLASTCVKKAVKVVKKVEKHVIAHHDLNGIHVDVHGDPLRLLS